MSTDYSASARRAAARNAGTALACTLLLALVLAPLPSLAAQQVAVRISGLSGEPLDNVRAALRLERRRQDSNLSADTIRELHGSAEREIRRALEPFGFYRPVIRSELQAPSEDGGAWRASYSIDPGAQVPIQHFALNVSGEGGEDAELSTLTADPGLREGQLFNHLQYEASKRDLLARVRGTGYLDAAYAQHRVEVDLEAYTASILLQLDTGPKYTIGPITFEQAEFQFAADYLERYLILHPGDTFSQAAITRQRNLLGRSGHFREVVIEAGEPDDRSQPAVPLTIRLAPYKANRYRGRLGWGSDTGIGVQADWNRRHIGHHGHRFTLGGTAVEERNRLAGDFSYLIPLEPLSGDRLELAARHESKDLTFEDVDLDEGGETRIATNLLSTFWHLPVASIGDFELRSRAGLSLVGETYDVFEVLFGNLPGNAQDAIIAAIGQQAYDTLAPDFEAVVPSLKLTARRTDDNLYIRRGDYFNLELLGADESLGSNIDFWQVRFNSWNIWPLGDSNRLLLRSAAGYSDAETRNVLSVDFNRMPEYFEFRAGGARSVRGYGYEELFPSTAITGGKHQLVGSVEYEHQIIPNWSAAVFLDAGNAFNDFSNIDEKLGTGIGVRWRSPVGVARIDLAFPVDDSEDAFQIYITVGPEF